MPASPRSALKARAPSPLLSPSPLSHQVLEARQRVQQVLHRVEAHHQGVVGERGHAPLVLCCCGKRGRGENKCVCVCVCLSVCASRQGGVWRQPSRGAQKQATAREGGRKARVHATAQHPTTDSVASLLPPAVAPCAHLWRPEAAASWWQQTCPPSCCARRGGGWSRCRPRSLHPCASERAREGSKGGTGSERGGFRLGPQRWVARHLSSPAASRALACVACAACRQARRPQSDPAGSPAAAAAAAAASASSAEAASSRL